MTESMGTPSSVSPAGAALTARRPGGGLPWTRRPIRRALRGWAGHLRRADAESAGGKRVNQRVWG